MAAGLTGRCSARYRALERPPGLYLLLTLSLSLSLSLSYSYPSINEVGRLSRYMEPARRVTP